MYSFICLFIYVVNKLQVKKPEWLPAKLQSWEWLPLWMRSLEPFDRVVCGPMVKYMPACCKGKAAKTAPAAESRSSSSSA